MMVAIRGGRVRRTAMDAAVNHVGSAIATPCRAQPLFVRREVQPLLPCRARSRHDSTVNGSCQRDFSATGQSSVYFRDYMCLRAAEKAIPRPGMVRYYCYSIVTVTIAAALLRATFHFSAIDTCFRQSLLYVARLDG
jgi:hypothetical protein